MIGGSVVGQTILHVNQRAPEIYRVKFIMKNDITSDLYKWTKDRIIKHWLVGWV